MRRPPFHNFAFAAIVFLAVLVSKATLNSAEESGQYPLSRVVAASVGPESALPRDFGAALVVPAPRAAAPDTVGTGASPAEEITLPQRVPPEITAIAALAGRMGDEEVAYKLNAYRRHPAASLTKLMTALAISEQLDPKALVTFTEEDLAGEGEAGNFSAGESYTVFETLQVMLAVSSNDAATVLARAYGNASLIEAMNSRARDLGMVDTVFFDPTGLSFLNQTTAWDFYKLVRYLFERRPEIFAATRAPNLTVREHTSGRTRRITNTNRFAGRRGFVGGKTGYTDEARQNLVSLFERGGITYTIIVLGSEARFEETEAILEWLTALR